MPNQIGLIIREHELGDTFFKEMPHSIILDLVKAKEMWMVEEFSKLEKPPIFPMIRIEQESPDVLVNMLQQASVMLNTNQFYISVFRGANELSVRALEDVITLLLSESDQLAGGKPVIHITAPARRFLDKNSLAFHTVQFCKQMGVEFHYLFLLSNSEESLSIFSTESFLKLLREDEYAEFCMQMLTINPETIVSELKIVTDWLRPSYFWGIENFGIYMEAIKPKITDSIPKEVIAFAQVTQRASSWDDIKCVNRTMRKFNVGDPDIWIVDFFPVFKTAKTYEGDFIHTRSFNIIRL